MFALFCNEFGHFCTIHSCNDFLTLLQVFATITHPSHKLVQQLVFHCKTIAKMTREYCKWVLLRPLDSFLKSQMRPPHDFIRLFGICRSEGLELNVCDEHALALQVRGARGGLKNFMGVNATYGAIGHACVTNKALLEKYMDYDIGELCRDDWVIGQQLIIRGCEPLPRRRCRARGPALYKQPLPARDSLWAIPADENIRWENYFCQNFSCLADYEHRKKFFKCSPCFDLKTLEKQRWMVPNSTDAEYLISEVLALKPDEIRIGLDYSMGTGTFAARMKEHDVTIVSTTLNLGAPFSETIALRGLIPLYISINQRLPFFDNTLDIVHTTLFLDAWVDHQLLDFILFDFDRVLRPGGLLWLDRFFCEREELAEYLFYFKPLRYKVHMWVTSPKTDKLRNEVYFSAVWEKPLTPFED